MRTRVKICGFTSADDALEAARLGVDAIGLVFYAPSPRNVSIEQAIKIIERLPAFVTVVGLFVDAEPNWIEQVLCKVRIDFLQFHGNEAPEACRAYHKPYMKAIRMSPDVNLPLLEDSYPDSAALLLDAYHPGIQGGTGSAFDWDRIPKQCKLPIVLAGGLSPDNVAMAIQKVNPYALDVSSGVETEKGIKDAQKMAAFIRKTNQATQQL
jgi:phosphoribosylanthranilate isomerase